MILSGGYAVGLDDVALALFRHRDEVTGAAAEERHGRVQVPAIEPLVVRRVAPKDQVVDRQDGRRAAQRQQQMLGGVEQHRIGDAAVEADSPNLCQPHQHPPRLVAQVDGGRGHAFQTGQRLDPGLTVVEEGQLVTQQRQ